MTHTNHRFTCTAHKLDDFVILAMPAKGLNDTTDAPVKLKEIFRIFMENNAINAGGVNAGVLTEDGEDAIMNRINTDTPILHGVFDNEQSVRQAIKEIKDKDLGISLVVSGPINVVKEMSTEAGTVPHSIAVAMGIIGNTSLLPPLPILELTTMCGHGMVHGNLIRSLIEDVVSKKTSVEKAVSILSKQCICGAFNTERAKQLIERIIEEGGKV